MTAPSSDTLPPGTPSSARSAARRSRPRARGDPAHELDGPARVERPRRGTQARGRHRRSRPQPDLALPRVRPGDGRRGRAAGDGGHPHLLPERDEGPRQEGRQRREPAHLRRPRQRLAERLRPVPGTHEERPGAQPDGGPPHDEQRPVLRRRPGCARTSSSPPTPSSSSATSPTRPATRRRACPSRPCRSRSSASTTSRTASSTSGPVPCGRSAGSRGGRHPPLANDDATMDAVFMTRYRDRSTRATAGSAGSGYFESVRTPSAEIHGRCVRRLSARGDG